MKRVYKGRMKVSYLYFVKIRTIFQIVRFLILVIMAILAMKIIRSRLWGPELGSRSASPKMNPLKWAAACRNLKFMKLRIVYHKAIP